MLANHEFALAAALMAGTLALLHALVWHRLRQRHSALFALGFAVGTALYGFDTLLQPGPHLAAMALGLGAIALLTLATIDYVGVHGRPGVTLRTVVVAVAVAYLAMRALGPLPRLVNYIVISGYFIVQAALFIAAARREPGRGHALVLMALLLFPATVVLAAFGGLEVGTLRYLGSAPAIVLGMTVLVTGLLRAEQARHELADTLEQRVAQRTAELHEMVAGLESFNRSVSHDLRGPLGGIAGLARLALLAHGRGDDAALARMLPEIAQQAESSSALVTSLLTLARVGEATLERAPVALQPLVDETLKELREVDPVTAPTPVTLKAPLPTVFADRQLLRQVYVNLIGNALKFTRGRPAPQIEAGALAGGDGTPVLYVRDNGIGFDPRQAAQLFEPFRRLHGGAVPGHGIGLSIVKRIVERHGGRIWADSTPGQGATFYFTLGAA